MDGSVYIFSSLEEAKLFIKDHETESNNRYIIQSRTKGALKKDIETLQKWTIKFEDKRGEVPIPYDGVPFVQLGSETRECHHGPSRNKNRNKEKTVPIPYDGVPYVMLGNENKECHHGPSRNKHRNKEKTEQETDDHSYNDASPNKKRKRICSAESKKQNCPAQIKFRMIIKFPQFKIEGENIQKSRLEMISKMKSTPFTDIDQQYNCMLKLRGTHNCHTVAPQISSQDQLVSETERLETNEETPRKKTKQLAIWNRKLRKYTTPLPENNVCISRNICDSSGNERKQNKMTLPGTTDNNLFHAYRTFNTDGSVHIFSSLPEAYQAVKTHEVQAGNRYILQGRTKDAKNRAVVSLEGWSIKFEDIRGAVPVPYDGVPFIQLGAETRECQYGPERNRNRKKKDMILQVNGNKSIREIKRRRVLKVKKKQHCPAQIKFRMLVKFPNFKIEGENNKTSQQEMIVKLRSTPPADLHQQYCVMVKFCATHNCVPIVGKEVQIDSVQTETTDDWGDDREHLDTQDDYQTVDVVHRHRSPTKHGAQNKQKARKSKVGQRDNPQNKKLALENLELRQRIAQLEEQLKHQQSQTAVTVFYINKETKDGYLES